MVGGPAIAGNEEVLAMEGVAFLETFHGLRAKLRILGSGR